MLLETVPFNAEEEFEFRCSAHKGEVRENLRVGKNVEFKVKASKVLRATKAKVLSFAQRSLLSAQIISKDSHFKRSKGEPQSQHVVLIKEIFPRLTKVRRDFISQSEDSS